MGNVRFLLLLAILWFVPACEQRSAEEYLPVETSVPPGPGDLELPGLAFDANGNISHLRDDETGEWYPLTRQESELATETYRELVTKVGPPRGYNLTSSHRRPPRLASPKPLKLEPLRPLKLEPLRPLKLEPLRPLKLEPLRPLKLEPLEPRKLER